MDFVKNMKEIICIDCKNVFIFSDGEQAFLAQLAQEGKIEQVVPPKRCPACRRQRKDSRQNREKRSYGVDY